jgi:hypothetical protein
VRADLLDIIEIFEVNRKECARLLVEYPKWAVIGTFKPRPGDSIEESDRKPLLGRDWQLESTLIEVIFFFHAPMLRTIYLPRHFAKPDYSWLAVPSS